MDRTALKELLIHPLAKGLDEDDPATTLQRLRIIREKGFLRKLYEQWYRDIIAAIAPLDGPVLEIGSGAGFLAEALPGLITSDVLHLPHVSLLLDATSIPFKEYSLSAIVMVDVLHHLPQPRRFFTESARCVRPGGTVVMIEPWVTTWSRFIYSRFHHEPFNPTAREWEFPSTGPLSGANGALPWIMFHRDKKRFEADFPMWRVTSIDLGMPVSYLVSGGVTMRALLPGSAFQFVRGLERLMGPFMQRIAMFARIVLTRI